MRRSVKALRLLARAFPNSTVEVWGGDHYRVLDPVAPHLLSLSLLLGLLLLLGLPPPLILPPPLLLLATLVLKLLGRVLLLLILSQGGSLRNTFRGKESD